MKKRIYYEMGQHLSRKWAGQDIAWDTIRLDLEENFGSKYNWSTVAKSLLGIGYLEETGRFVPSEIVASRSRLVKIYRIT